MLRAPQNLASRVHGTVFAGEPDPCTLQTRFAGGSFCVETKKEEMLRRSATWAMRRSAARTAGVGMDIPDVEPDACTNPLDDDNTDHDGNAADDDSELSLPNAMLNGRLIAKVTKENKRSRWDTRWIELHESFMVLLVYRTRLDFERKTPQHIYLLSELLSVQNVKKSALTIGLDFNEDAATGVPPKRQLKYKFGKLETAVRWLSYCRRAASAAEHARMQRDRWMHARGVSVKLPRNGQGHGMTFRNLDDEPVGVAICSLAPESPMTRLGLGVDDIILAVNEIVCLSHSHAQELVEEVDRRFELIVCSRHTQRIIETNPEPIGIS